MYQAVTCAWRIPVGAMQETLLSLYSIHNDLESASPVAVTMACWKAHGTLVIKI